MIVKTGISWFNIDKTDHENLTKSFEITKYEAFWALKLLIFEQKQQLLQRSFQ